MVDSPPASRVARARPGPVGGGGRTHFDGVIIGSGAGGGTLARQLAAAGNLRVLVLDAATVCPREPQNRDREEVMEKGRYLSKNLWLDAAGKTFQPGSHYFAGGATKMYGAAYFRLRELDFEQLVHREWVYPPAAAVCRFRSLVSTTEELYPMHGLRREDPTEPHSGPYPHPPVSHEPRMQQLVDDLRAIGLHPFHAPSGLLFDDGQMAFGRCRRCNRCDGFPCLVNAKGDAEVIGIRPALATPAVSLLTRAQVKRLHTDATGRTVTAVELERDGEPLRVSGDVVVVSCGAANSAPIRWGGMTCFTTARRWWPWPMNPIPPSFRKQRRYSNDGQDQRRDHEGPCPPGNVPDVGLEHGEDS